METLKEFLEAKLAKCGFSNFKWERIIATNHAEEDTIYVTCTNPDDHGAKVTMPLVELVNDLLWQENGV